jgi:hypothetical protein
MADIFTATGTKVFIGPSVTSATDTNAEFAALTYTEIGLVESLGEFGDQSSAVTFAVIGDGRTRKAKGARDAGSVSITVAHGSDDAGQAALIAAEATYNNYAFKVVLPNRLNVGGTDEIQYFRGLVMSKRMNVGGNDNVVRDTFEVGINSPVYVVPATAA